MLAHRIAVHGGHRRHGAATGDQRTDHGVVVDQIEIRRPDQVIHPGQMSQLRQRLAEPRELQLGRGGDEAAGRAAADISYRPINERGDRIRPMLAWLDDVEEADPQIVMAAR